jgi:hypothetical protein
MAKLILLTLTILVFAGALVTAIGRRGAGPGPALDLPLCRNIQLENLVAAESAGTERTYEGRFEIANSGSADLEFRVLSSCACSAISPNEGRVPPGKSQHITVAIRLKSPGHQSAEIILASNDSIAPQVRLRVHANWLVPIAATPARVDLGHVVLGHTATAVVQLIRSDKKPLSTETHNISSSHEALQAALRDDSGTLDIALLGTCDRGLYKGEVIIRGPGLDSPILVPVIAYIVDELFVSPPVVQLRPEPNGEVAPARIIVQHYSGQEVPALISHDLPDGLQLKEIAGAAAGQRCFEISGQSTTAIDTSVNLALASRSDAVSFRVQLSLPAASHGPP